MADDGSPRRFLCTMGKSHGCGVHFKNGNYAFDWGKFYRAGCGLPNTLARVGGGVALFDYESPADHGITITKWIDPE